METPRSQARNPEKLACIGTDIVKGPFKAGLDDDMTLEADQDPRDDASDSFLASGSKILD